MEDVLSQLKIETKNSNNFFSRLAKSFVKSTEKYPYEKELKQPMHKIFNNLGALKELTSGFSIEKTDSENIKIANEINKLSLDISSYPNKIAGLLENIENKEKKISVHIENEKITTANMISLLRQISIVLNHVEKSCDAKKMESLLKNSTNTKTAFKELIDDLQKSIDTVYKRLKTFL